MLSLYSTRWNDLSHAHGAASDVPDLIRRLDAARTDADVETAWAALWHTLRPRSRATEAAYAALPHLLKISLARPTKARWHLFALLTGCELARQGLYPADLPDDLARPYQAAVAQVPKLIQAGADLPWDADTSRAAAGALAAAKGHARLAAAILKLDDDMVEKVLRET